MKNTKQKQKSKNGKPIFWKNVIGSVLVAMFGGVVFLSWGELKGSFTIVGSVSVFWIVLGVLLYACTQLFGSISYYCLALKKVKWSELYIVEWASAGINRLLPAGAGSMGIHGLYLLKRKHSVAETVTVVGLNNLMSITTHLLLLLVVLFFMPRQLDGQKIIVPANAGYIALISVGIIALLFAIRKVRGIVKKFFIDLLHTIKSYKRKPAILIGSAAAVICLTATNTVLLFTMMHAAGMEADILVAFLAFSIGTAFGALFPTPGGLGGVETGLVGALLMFGADSAVAFAVAILFRFVTYWIPLLLGNMVFVAIRKKNYF